MIPLPENKSHLAKLLTYRFLAAFLDYSMFFSIVASYFYYFSNELRPGVFVLLGFDNYFYFIFLWLLMFPISEGIFGYTLFKGLFNLKVMPDKRESYSFLFSLRRRLADPIDFFLFGFVGVVLIIYTKESKRLGDFWSETYVDFEPDEHISN